MQVNLGDLLEEISNAPTGKEHDFNSLADVFKNKGVPPDEIYALIDAAWKNLLIKNKSYPVKETQQDEARAPTDIKFILNIPGFEFLNQIQINKAIVKFNESSDKSYEQIIDLTDKLGLSVEKLYLSSERLEKLNHILIALTFFIVLLTILLIPEQYKFFLVFAYIMFIIVLYRRKLLRIFRK